jgi:uncharacterized protein (DUF433 family)
MKFDRISVDPARMNGQPCVRNMRLTVRRVVELAAFYPDREELRQEYPELEGEDIQQAATVYADLHRRGELTNDANILITATAITHGLL